MLESQSQEDGRLHGREGRSQLLSKAQPRKQRHQIEYQVIIGEITRIRVEPFGGAG